MAGKVYETAIRINAAISATFKPGVLTAATAVERLAARTKDLKAAERATEQFARLSGELATARSKFDGASDALARLKAAEVAAGGATKESAKWTRAGERAVAAAAREVNRAATATGRNAHALRVAGVDTKDLTAAQKKLEAQIAATERRTNLAAAVNQHFGKTLEAMGKRAGAYSTLEGSAGKVRDATGSLLADAAKLAGLGVAAGVGIFHLAKRTGEAGFELSTTATKLGTTTNALQLLRSAGRKSGVEVEALETGLGKLAINLGKVIATKGKGTGAGLVGEVGGINFLGLPGAAKAGAVDPFKHIKLSAKELAALAPEEQVKRIADGIAGLKTHAEQSAAAVQIFGKGGLAMLPLLAKGSAGIEAYYAQARASGNLLSAETIENSRKFHLAYLGMGAAVNGIRNTFGAALLPVVTKVLGEFNAWIQSNRGKVKVWAEQLAVFVEQKAIPAVRQLAAEAVKIAGRVGEWIDKNGGLIEALKSVAIGVAAIRLAPLGLAMTSLGINAARLAIALVPLAPAIAPFLVAAAPLIAISVALLAIKAAAQAIADAFDDATAARLKFEDAEAFKADEARRAMNREINAPGKSGSARAAAPTTAAALSAEDEIRARAARSFAIPITSTGPRRKDYAPGVAPAIPVTATGAKLLHYAPTINVGAGPRDEVSKQIDIGNARAKAEALKAYDEREAQRRRVSFG